MALPLKAKEWCARRTSDSPVLPFKHQDADVADKQLWFGPTHIGCFVLEIYGPMQLLLWALILPAMVFLGLEIDKQSKEDFVDYHRYSTAIGCLAFAILLCPFAKNLYIIKLLRLEILNFRKLNRALQSQVEEFTKQVGDLAKENDTYKTANSHHAELNAELRQQFEKQQRECTRQEEINTKLSHEVSDLKATVSDLQRVEKQLLLLSNECAGSVEQARGLLTRLERNLKLDTVNTVFLFFDRCDRDRDGKIDASELDLFFEQYRKPLQACGRLQQAEYEGISLGSGRPHSGAGPYIGRSNHVRRMPCQDRRKVVQVVQPHILVSRTCENIRRRMRQAFFRRVLEKCRGMRPTVLH